MKNIAELKNCYGCGVCVAVCPRKIIRLEKNSNGFYEPSVFDDENCINCGLCLDVCAFNHPEIADSTKEFLSFAGWSKHTNVRRYCSSGGISFEVGCHLISKGYKAIGVKYNVENRRAEHFIASTNEEFKDSIGSKYIPSFTSDAFKHINRKDKYLIVGTPCQIDSLRHFIRRMKMENNFFLLDFFCHGTPSLLLWEKYLYEVEKIVGEVKSVSWRSKMHGWHDLWSMDMDNPEYQTDWHDSYCFKIKGEKHDYRSRRSKGDLFYNFFLGNYCLNDCCYHKCKYKYCSSAADIRIGDLWGKSFANNTEGVNAVIAFTSKGEQLIQELDKEFCDIYPKPIETITEGQMKKMPKRPFIVPLVLRAFNSKLNLRTIHRIMVLPYWLIFLMPVRIINKIKRFLTK
ncbi:MAG: Coenzyme F420 hydrogenase/dehydrogenase, beta subunit C-terminal domain [Muribaculum sp.]|nr:Coenzyme F420 hydrogenase/dehydrogenase, beta subunit C-terminal domain [Muribaculum sp.]